LCTIAVVAPSGIFDRNRLEKGIQFLERNGCTVLSSPNLYATHRVTAGTITQRVSDFLWAMEHPDIDVICFARGGYGCIEILEHIDFQDCEKLILGFSDATAMGAAISNLHQSNFVHAPVLHSLSDHSDEVSQEHFLSFLHSKNLVCPTMSGKWLCHPISSSIKYPVVGGNLCMLTTLLGTPWQLNCHNKILLLEEIAEPAYKIQRMLKHLIYSGMLNGCKAIGLGSWSNCKLPVDVNWTLLDLIIENLQPLGIPVFHNLPFGHGRENWLWRANQNYSLDESACLSPSKTIENFVSTEIDVHQLEE
jgi:muramoyltetrapeptide carboxypeptidase